MLNASLAFTGIDPSLWSESIKSAAYVYNNLPNEALNWATPSDIWLDKTLVLADKFYPFGELENTFLL